MRPIAHKRDRNVDNAVASLFVMAIAIMIFASGSLAQAEPVPLPFTTDNWEGAQWCYGGPPSPWFPSAGGSSVLLAQDDYCWQMLRATTTMTAGDEITVEVNPSLNSGGTNNDKGFVGIGEMWGFPSPPTRRAIGLAFTEGKIALIDHPSEPFPWFAVRPETPTIGSYVPGEWITVKLRLHCGWLEVVGPGFVEFKILTGLTSTPYLFLGEGDTQDGVQYRNVMRTHY
jgi:hypothetical protein